MSNKLYWTNGTEVMYGSPIDSQKLYGLIIKTDTPRRTPVGSNVKRDITNSEGDVLWQLIPEKELFSQESIKERCIR